MSEKPEQEPQGSRLWERPAPEFFAHDAAGYFMHDGVMTLTFYSAFADHSDPPGPVNRVVAGRVTMPIPAVQRLAIGLYDFLKQRGLDPAEVIKTEGDPSRWWP